LAALLLLWAPLAGASGQVTPAAPDSARADTVPADSAAASRPPPDAAADSVMQVLRALEGFVATEYQGNSAIYRAEEGVLRLQGAAEVDREGNRLTADTIVYRSRT